jgi:predicted nucleotidyltransferase component of viral defense system
MGRAKGDPANGLSALDGGRASPSVLPEHTIAAWRVLRPILPRELYLGGGTAVAVHLRHRESHDLDFFFHDSSVDLVALADTLRTLRIAITLEGEGTLHALRGETKVEFFHAETQRLLAPTSTFNGLRIASLQDLIAMKLKVVGSRGELRDYYDLKLIEEEGGMTIEDGIAFFLKRYDVSPASDALQHVVRALGYLGDVEDDDRLPMTKDELADWWADRQVRLIRHLARNPL